MRGRARLTCDEFAPGRFQWQQRLVARPAHAQDRAAAGRKALGGVDVAQLAIALERAFLPPQFEADLPEDPDEAADFVAKHPNKTDVRVVVGVLRDGTKHGLARLVSDPDDLLGAEDLVPGLAEALFDTFRSDES